MVLRLIILAQRTRYGYFATRRRNVERKKHVRCLKLPDIGTDVSIQFQAKFDWLLIQERVHHTDFIAMIDVPSNFTSM